jgi:hypothetical protein
MTRWPPGPPGWLTRTGDPAGSPDRGPGGLPGPGTGRAPRTGDPAGSPEPSPTEPQ